MTRPVPPDRTAFRQFEQLQTRWADNDIYGHMNNAYHYQLFDTAVNGYLLRHGIINLTDSPCVFLVVSSGCDYFAELRFPDIIHAGIHVTRLGSSAVHYGIGLFKNDDLAAAAFGTFVHVNVDRKTKKPTPISPFARDTLMALHI